MKTTEIQEVVGKMKNPALCLQVENTEIGKLYTKLNDTYAVDLIDAGLTDAEITDRHVTAINAILNPVIVK